MKKSEHESIVLSTRIEGSIIHLREQKVMLDTVLAVLYGVEVKALIQSVKRNAERFPNDFVFQLTQDELNTLRSQSVTARDNLRRSLPYAFTEQGVAMLSSVLRSPRAVAVNIEIMRAFVRMRRLLESNKELAKRLDELEKKYDKNFAMVFEAIRQLMMPPEPKKRKIGFKV